eukprot:m.328595 g.328595  ORF g.328595 m.328595 type:complete len:199 (+) comp16034_c3_seq2:2696-3292(+)
MTNQPKQSIKASLASPQPQLLRLTVTPTVTPTGTPTDTMAQFTRTTSIQQTVAEAQQYLLVHPPASPRRLSQHSLAASSSSSQSDDHANDHDNDNDSLADDIASVSSSIGGDLAEDVGAIADFAPSTTTSATSAITAPSIAQLTRASTMTQTIADAAHFLALPVAMDCDRDRVNGGVMTRGRERRLRDCPARNLRKRK